MDYYEILGVAKGVTLDEIKAAYRKKCLETHPDRNLGDVSAGEKFNTVQSAYETLSDPVRRAQYDGGFHSERTPPPRKKAPRARAPDFSSIYEEFFGGGTERGRNIQVRVEVELTDILHGCRKHIIVKKRPRCGDCSGKGYSSFVPCEICGGSGFGAKVTNNSPFQFTMQCKACQGSGKSHIEKCESCVGFGFGVLMDKDLLIVVPPGMENGMQVRVQGEGEEGKLGSRTGDLFIVVLIKDHPIFKRDGRDLSCDVPVSYTQLVLGDEIELPTLENGTVKVKVPAGTQANTRFRMKGRGLPGIQHPLSLGDIVATVKVESPSKLDDEYRKVLERLAELERKYVTPKRQEFAKKL